VSKWIVKGLQTGMKTTCYPAEADGAAGASPGFPAAGQYTEADARLLSDRCPTSALKPFGGRVEVDHRRCIHCFRCVRGTETQMEWNAGYEWAVSKNAGAGGPLDRAFERSIHILVVDAGDCGACLNEVRQLDNPYYNIHRLGFFITPTPRQADVLLVVGPVTDHMRLPLQKTYDAMPTPKCVVAAGACALSGGVFGPSFVTGKGVAEVIPVDVEVPGNPPPPLAILHGLLVVTGRKQSAEGAPR
jgi:Ni,Fe-hydrogenase III small subunit